MSMQWSCCDKPPNGFILPWVCFANGSRRDAKSFATKFVSKFENWTLNSLHIAIQLHDRILEKLKEKYRLRVVLYLFATAENRDNSWFVGKSLENTTCIIKDVLTLLHQPWTRSICFRQSWFYLNPNLFGIAPWQHCVCRVKDFARILNLAKSTAYYFREWTAWKLTHIKRQQYL